MPFLGLMPAVHQDYFDYRGSKTSLSFPFPAELYDRLVDVLISDYRPGSYQCFVR